MFYCKCACGLNTTIEPVAECSSCKLSLCQSLYGEKFQCTPLPETKLDATCFKRESMQDATMVILFLVLLASLLLWTMRRGYGPIAPPS
ncbi:hypothetical protein RI367_003666 [Sorochytrium milnesiophthora]